MTFPEQYQKQIERVQEMQKCAEDIGPAGGFYVSVCEEVVSRAKKALADYDTVRMVEIYKEMQEIKL